MFRYILNNKLKGIITEEKLDDVRHGIAKDMKDDLFRTHYSNIQPLEA